MSFVFIIIIMNSLYLQSKETHGMKQIIKDLLRELLLKDEQVAELQKENVEIVNCK